MHGLEEANASQIRQRWRVIAIGAAGQCPRVFLMCA
jgi:16S rRNA U1498 N3-methylase RsmE